MKTSWCRFISKDTLNGHRTCVPPRCGVAGQCQGVSVRTSSASGVNDCLLTCRRTPGCRWFTYFAETSACLTFSSCSFVDKSCDGCVSGERDCPEQLSDGPSNASPEAMNGRGGGTLSFSPFFACMAQLGLFFLLLQFFPYRLIPRRQDSNPRQ